MNSRLSNFLSSVGYPMMVALAVPVLAFVFDFIDTVPKAKEREAIILASMLTRVTALEAKVKDHDDFDARSYAGVSTQLMKHELGLAAAWTDRCAVLPKPRSDFDEHICSKLGFDYDEAKRRYESAATDASKTWKSK